MAGSKPPPSYEETIADGPKPSSAAINEAYVADAVDEVVQQAPTAPPIGIAPPVRVPLMSLLKLTDDELRETLYKFSSEFCCYGSRFIREMILTDIYDDSAFHYKLESFGEKRESTLRFTPYYGQSIDGPENGPAPAPWDVPVGLPTRFIDHRITTEIPHTARVETCTTCDGDKQVECRSCSGWGTSSCTSCSGSGRDSEDDSCSSCGGSGTETCWNCSGTGKVDCSTCDGYGKVKWFRLLIVTWTNHVDHFVSNKDTLSRNLIIEASGTELFNEQGDQVVPTTSAPDRIVNEASAVLIQKHNTSFLDELIRAQRHNLRAVPFTKANYVWRDKNGEFFVYGFDKKVYFEDYPQQCCCCICC